MTLSFQTHWPKTMPPHMAGKPTYFPEKIISKIPIDENIRNYVFSDDTWLTNEDTKLSDIKTKIHTIREDAGNRWKAGNDIHMVINNRTKNRLQFAPVMKCVSVQKIEIHNHDGKGVSLYSFVKIDRRQLGWPEIEKLATNDGFDSVEDFFSWFNEDFKGKIIHWTDLKY